MQKEIEALLKKIISQLGYDCLYDKSTKKYVDDIARDDYSENVKRLLKVALESEFTKKFESFDDIQAVCTYLKNYTFWSDEVVNQIVFVFVKVLGISVQ